MYHLHAVARLNGARKGRGRRQKVSMTKTTVQCSFDADGDSCGGSTLPDSSARTDFHYLVSGIWVDKALMTCPK